MTGREKFLSRKLSTLMKPKGSAEDSLVGGDRLLNTSWHITVPMGMGFPAHKLWTWKQRGY